MRVWCDYLSAILGTVRDGSSWTLNIQGERRESDHRLLERGQGNSCSVEFNVLYRLHPSMSREDADYTGEQFSRLFYGGETPPNWDEVRFFILSVYFFLPLVVCISVGG
jgi:hypothetical protein